MDIVSEMKKGNKRAVARLISMLENNDPSAIPLMKELWKYSSETRIIGITGPPGAGKSTLTDQLAKHVLKMGKKVGIIAVDPSSPITGGAFLGDRVRMAGLNLMENVFIRSMGTRGALGGISKAVYGAIRALEAFGADYIFVETVGVGQSEVDISSVADTVVLVAVPGMGDDIQAGKAGILEVVDVIAVNKADHPDCDRTVANLKAMLANEGTTPVILKTTATANSGTEELFEAVERHYYKIKKNGNIEMMHYQRLYAELKGVVLGKFEERFREYDKKKGILDKAIDELMKNKKDPYTLVDEIYRGFILAGMDKLK